MLKKFHIVVSSATEFAAIKAALATKNILVTDLVETVLKRYCYKSTIGNYYDGGVDEGVKCVNYEGFHVAGSKVINGIAELIQFLESGEYKVKETEYTITRTTIVKDFIKVKATNAKEAEKLARHAQDSEYFQTSRGTEYNFE